MNTHKKIRSVFCDIDNTLIHKERSDIKIPEEANYISNKTINLVQSINDKIPFVLISGRSAPSYDRISSIIPHSYAILEHGAVVTKDGKMDKDWMKLIYPYSNISGEGILWDYEKEMQKRYITSSKGRMASFRIRPQDNNMREEEMERLANEEHPYGIKTVRNNEFLDFLPAMAGKENAVEFIIAKRLGLSWNQVACIGDDVNDRQMLLKAGYRFTFADANPKLMGAMKGRDIYITPYSSHKGIEDILERILK